jgi:hypothetical protein
MTDDVATGDCADGSYSAGAQHAPSSALWNVSGASDVVVEGLLPSAPLPSAPVTSTFGSDRSAISESQNAEHHNRPFCKQCRRFFDGLYRFGCKRGRH